MKSIFLFSMLLAGWTCSVLSQDASAYAEADVNDSEFEFGQRGIIRRKLCRKFGLCGGGYGGYQGSYQGGYQGYQGYPVPPINIGITQAQSSASAGAQSYWPGPSYYGPFNYQYNGYPGYSGYNNAYRPGYFGNGYGSYNNQFNGNYYGPSGYPGGYPGPLGFGFGRSADTGVEASDNQEKSETDRR